MIPNKDLPVTYSFVSDGKFVNKLLGFELKNDKIGDIILSKPLNRTESIQREV